MTTFCSFFSGCCSGAPLSPSWLPSSPSPCLLSLAAVSFRMSPWPVPDMTSLLDSFQASASSQVSSFNRSHIAIQHQFASNLGAFVCDIQKPEVGHLITWLDLNQIWVTNVKICLTNIDTRLDFDLIYLFVSKISYPVDLMAGQMLARKLSLSNLRLSFESVLLRKYF